MNTPNDDCTLCRRLANIATDPALLATFDDCIVILGDNQGTRGWCTLITTKHIEHLDQLAPAAQSQLFLRVATVARAIRTAFLTSGKDNNPPRINYECLGNVCPHAHWHIIPRHSDDPTPRATVWGWEPQTLAGTDEWRSKDITLLRNLITTISQQKD